jgi:hypothetical protein
VDGKLNRSPEAIARIHFAWSADAKCRATAYDRKGDVLGDLVVEMPPATQRDIAAVRGPGAHLRIEEVAERHLRAMLDLRY